MPYEILGYYNAIIDMSRSIKSTKADRDTLAIYFQLCYNRGTLSDQTVPALHNLVSDNMAFSLFSIILFQYQLCTRIYF